jgi:hypothetical protein
VLFLSKSIFRSAGEARSRGTPPYLPNIPPYLPNVSTLPPPGKPPADVRETAAADPNVPMLHALDDPAMVPAFVASGGVRTAVHASHSTDAAVRRRALAVLHFVSSHLVGAEKVVFASEGALDRLLEALAMADTHALREATSALALLALHQARITAPFARAADIVVVVQCVPCLRRPAASVAPFALMPHRWQVAYGWTRVRRHSGFARSRCTTSSQGARSFWRSLHGWRATTTRWSEQAPPRRSRTWLTMRRSATRWRTGTWQNGCAESVCGVRALPGGVGGWLVNWFTWGSLVP